MPGDSTTLDDFHLDRGGPFYRLIRATRFAPPRRRMIAAAAFTWLPFLGFELAARLTGGEREPIFSDLSVHARLLIALPLIMIAEQLLDRLGHETVTRLRAEAFLPDSDLGRFARLLQRAKRLRDSYFPELLLGGAAIAIGFAALAGVVAPSGFVHGVEAGRSFTPARIWYTLVGLPLFQFVLWRSLWRWTIWIYVMAELSRIDLRLEPVHPDRQGGISFLRRPLVGFCVMLTLASSCVVCASWATEILQHRGDADSFKPLFYLLVIGSVALSYWPLLLFTPQLVRARVRGLTLYGALATESANRFHRRWIDREAGEGETLLDANDACALIDYTSVYRESVDKFRVVLVGVRDVVLLLVANVLPALGVLLINTPPVALLEKLTFLLFGIKR